jgi:2Fe-2S ferredoxin
MPKVIYVHFDGQRQVVEVASGVSLMQAAVNNGVAGIVGECGGSAMCATCHVYVDPSHLGLLPPMQSTEDALLDGTASDRRENSRLGCQIVMTAALDGITVELPEKQI